MAVKKAKTKKITAKPVAKKEPKLSVKEIKMQKAEEIALEKISTDLCKSQKFNGSVIVGVTREKGKFVLTTNIHHLSNEDVFKIAQSLKEGVLQRVMGNISVNIPKILETLTKANKSAPSKPKAKGK